MNAAARKASPVHTKATIARYDVSAASCAEEDARLQQEQELLDQFFAGDSAVQGGEGSAGSDTKAEIPSKDSVPSLRPMPASPVATACQILEIENQSDEQLTVRLEEALIRSGVRAFANLSLSVTKGMAHLEGELDSHYELVIALQLVSRTTGVAGVRHSITVKPELEEKITWTEIATETVRENRRTIVRWAKVAAVLLVGGLLSAAGARYWQANAAPPVPVVAAHGTIEFDGKPASGAILQLHPVKARKDLPNLPQALADEAGRFDLSTFRRNDGAPAGEYVVTVTWRPDVTTKDGRTERGPNVIPSKWTKPTSSPLRITISQQGGDLGTVVVPR